MRARHLALMLIPLAFAVSCAGTPGKNTCESDDDCLSGGIEYGCDTTNTKVCLRKCTAATETTDCLASQVCDVPAGETDGLCRTSGSQSGDPGSAGDPGAGD